MQCLVAWPSQLCVLASRMHHTVRVNNNNDNDDDDNTTTTTIDDNKSHVTVSFLRLKKFIMINPLLNVFCIFAVLTLLSGMSLSANLRLRSQFVRGHVSSS